MSYYTVKTCHVAEREEKRSRFVATLLPIADFDKILDTLRKEHRKANHHVSAFRLMQENGQIQEIGRDDGEPSGTSGMPVLKTMVGAGLMDSAIIVTRYFGGIKLGTGGLARAYAGAAKAVIDEAKLVEWVTYEQIEFSIPFDKSSQVEHQSANLGLNILERRYDEEGVTLTIQGPKTALEEFKNDMPDKLHGRLVEG